MAKPWERFSSPAATQEKDELGIPETGPEFYENLPSDSEGQGPWQKFSTQKSYQDLFSDGMNVPEIAEQQGVSQREVIEGLTFGQRLRNDARIIGDEAIGAVRGVAQGATDIVSIPSNFMGWLANKALPGDPFSENVNRDMDQFMSSIGIPETTTAGGSAAEDVVRTGAGLVGGEAAMSRLIGRPPVNAPITSQPIKAVDPAAQVLERAGVPLDRSQQTGGRFWQMMRSAVSNHPFTASRQAGFAGEQQKAFNRAVLRAIGENADEASQSVMSSARTRIGGMFDEVGKLGASFDDTLQSNVSSIVDEAHRTVTDSNLRPFLRNIDDLLNAVDDAGRINGDQLIQLRSNLSKLSRNDGIGPVARQLHDALLDALERSHPGQKQLLSDARDQWRNLRIIQDAIGKGANRDISPLRLSSIIGNRANQNMSVYGIGGDQSLVDLAQAGRSVLPQVLPDSGTIPRGLMQSPLRAILSAPVYKAGQRALLPSANTTNSGSGTFIGSLVAPVSQENDRRQMLINEMRQ